MEDKFIYQDEKEFQLLDSQCEVCIYYNKGGFSTECPIEGREKIRANICKCPKKRVKSILD